MTLLYYAESAVGLQQALCVMCDYCDKWSLWGNAKKRNKIVGFSIGKIRKTPTIKYMGQPLEVVFDLQYLGLCFHYNIKFNVAQKHFYDKAFRAMFGLLKNVDS